MVTGGQATRYLLLHLTNSDDGRDLIKECSWSITPDGGFVVRKSDNPDQQFLLERKPDLAPLREWVVAKLRERPYRWQELHTAVRPEPWLKKHVNKVVRALKREEKIEHTPIPKGRKFGAEANPLLNLKN